MVTEDLDPVSQFQEFMADKGLNITNQRKAIAEVFFKLPGHHSLEEFYRHILRSDPGIGQTTVYRTLKLLCEAGLATENQFDDNITRFEISARKSHHDHMICRKCGRIIEICDARIEKLQKEIAESHGFSLEGHLHNLYGVCKDCQ